MTIDLNERYYNLVRKITEKYPYKFLVFGSRAKGTAHKFSDLDLCVIDEIPSNVIFNIEEDFRESDLPFKVEILEWNKASEDFRKTIKKDLISL
jgi:uncharacterized protein